MLITFSNFDLFTGFFQNVLPENLQDKVILIGEQYKEPYVIKKEGGDHFLKTSLLALTPLGKLWFSSSTNSTDLERYKQDKRLYHVLDEKYGINIMGVEIDESDDSIKLSRSEHFPQ